MSFTTIGRVQTITPPQTITTKQGQPFTFAEMTIGVVGYQNRTDTMFFRVTGNSISAMATLQQGQEIEVKFDARCRNYQDKDGHTRWSTDLVAWDIRPHMAQPTQYAAQVPQPTQYAQAPAFSAPRPMPQAQPAYPQMSASAPTDIPF